MKKSIIQKAAVIGAGVMGSGIAAHLANTGIPVLLLDIVPKDAQDRSIISKEAVKKQLKSKLCGFYHKSFTELITCGNLEDDLESLANVDWIIEVVPENVEIKHNLFEKLDSICEEVTAISSNTSGIPLKLLTKDRSETFKKKFMVTHFFNPPRYMHLVEMVAGPETDTETFNFIKDFIETKMGKGVVECFDTPNFIANRIGCFDLIAAMKAMEKHGLSISEVDTVAGVPAGRPKTAVFRLLDMIGLDTISFVIANMYKMLPNDEFRDDLKVPDYLSKMVENKLLGSKSGAGFYKKDKEGIKVLNFEKMDYELPERVDLPELKDVKKHRSAANRVKALCSLDTTIGQFAKDYLSRSCLYAAYRVPDTAANIYDIDRAMKWGYNHEIGPFEIWDALGVRETAEYLKNEGLSMPSLVEDLLSEGHDSFYQEENGLRTAWNPVSKSYKPLTERPGTVNVKAAKDKGLLEGSNPSVSLIGLDNNVLYIQLHSKRNVFNTEVVQTITEAMKMAEGNFKAAVIGSIDDTFSVGADLTEMVGASQSGDQKSLYNAIANFQEMSMAVRHSPFPVVAALTGYTFGGGCEIAMHCDARQSAPETWMGLVEAGVGLLPAGGGCKEMARITYEKCSTNDLFDELFNRFLTVAMAKVSKSAFEMQDLGFGNKIDGISKNKETLTRDAILRAELLASQGYVPPVRDEKIKVAGMPVLTEIRARLNIMEQSGYISNHDSLIADKIAIVMCGGEVEAGTFVNADYLLSLERDCFFSLLQEGKTIERITHTLKTGKPLRN